MDKLSVKKTIDLVKEIKGSNAFYDVHVHPFEVMFNPLTYNSSPLKKGVFSTGSTMYTPPDYCSLNLRNSENMLDKEFDPNLKSKVMLLQSRQIYAHTGPGVLTAEMDLCAIDKSFLLPVVRENETGNGQLQMIQKLFGSDERFFLGYCLPNDIPNSKIADNVNRIVKKYGIKVLKIHPAVTGLDLSSQAGSERVEAILNAADNAKLKVIIHGGKSPECPNSEAISYGTIEKLQHIDWSITSEAVVIAHSGCYGYSAKEVQELVLPVMEKLLNRYSHLTIDTSGIGLNTLSIIFRNIDLQRIVFGSDSLYEKQWAAMVKLWHALERSVEKPDEILLQIMSINPSSLFGFEQNLG